MDVNITLRDGAYAVAVKPTGAVVLVAGNAQIRADDFQSVKASVAALTKDPASVAALGLLVQRAERAWKAVYEDMGAHAPKEVRPALPASAPVRSVVRKG